MKVFILTLDSLEYKLVVKWKLKNLMQFKCGYFEDSDEYLHEETKVPYTYYLGFIHNG